MAEKTTVSVDLEKALTAGETYSCYVTVHVGSEGVSAGAKIKVEFPCYWGWGGVQTSDSRKDNYVEVCMSNPDVDFMLQAEWSHSILIELTQGKLKSGDEIKISCGNPQSPQGGISVSRWASITPHSQIWSAIDVTIDDKRIEGSPVIANVKSSKPAKIIVVIPSMCECDKEYKAKFAVVDKNHNLVTDYDGEVTLSCDGLDLPGKCEIHSGIGSFNLKCKANGIYNIRAEADNIAGISNSAVCDNSPVSENLFWGDIHGHSCMSDGVCSVDDYYVYARDVAGLDFTALTDHDARWGRRRGKDINESEWEELKSKARKYNEPGEFATLQSYEWTSNTHGHRDVYYRDDNPPMFSCSQSDSDTAEKLWDKIKGLKAMSIPHHPSGLRFCIADGCAPVDWTVRNDEMQRLVEVFSVHGNSEYFDNPQKFRLMHHAGHFLQDALRQGHRFGIISSSDCHNGHPGLSGMYDYHSYDPSEGAVEADCCRGCLVGVYSTELTREAIWDALWNRRCYATTGKRIILDFRVDDHFMGEEYTSDSSRRKIFVKVIGMAAIKTIEIIKNNNVIISHAGSSAKEEILRYDETSDDGVAYYYARITQADGEFAWSSPVWVS